MAFNSGHWTIDYSAKTVTNNDSGTGANLPHSGETYLGEVLDLFKWLAQEFASTSQMDDTYPMASDTPTVFKWLDTWGFGHADDFKYLTGGDITSADGLDAWFSVYMIGSPTAGTQMGLIQAGAEVSAWWDTDNVDILIKVKSGGTWIQSVDKTETLADAGIWLYTRAENDYYNHGYVSLLNGRQPIGLDTSIDKGNQTPSGTVAGWNDISITFGTVSKDLNNGGGSVDYDVVIDCAGRPMTQVYEYLKYVTRWGETTLQLNGDDGQVYRSANQGVYAEVKVAPFGTLAGTTYYGARGVWVENYLSPDFELIDATGTTQAPPKLRNVVASHSDLDGSVSTDGGCNVFVAEVTGDGGGIIKNKYTTSSSTSNTITTTAPIQANRTLQSGVIRVADVQYSYTGFSGSTFTGVTPDCSGLTNEDFYTPLMDRLADDTQEVSDNLIYDDNPFWVITSVRRYGTKPYDVYTQFGETGVPFTPVLSNDPQAT